MILKRNKTKEEKYFDDMKEILALNDWVIAKEWEASLVPAWAVHTRQEIARKFDIVERRYGKEFVRQMEDRYKESK